MKLRAIKPRTDGGGIPYTAGCVRCDDEMEMVDEVHHKDGAVCRVMARNYALMDRKTMGPLGRYSPSKDPYRSGQ